MALKRYLAYTLLEILVTVAVLGSVASGTYIIITRVAEASVRAKLDQDVKSVNRAIQIYMAHGGNIPPLVSGDDVLARLRREAANPHLAGLKGSVIDPRMTIRWQKASEAAASGPRAYWDNDKKLFTIAESGTTPGVKEFFSGELPAPLPMVTAPDGTLIDPNLDDRMTTKDFATVDKWVWDYNSLAAAGRISPERIPTGNANPGSGATPSDPSTVPLDPPLFSVDGASYALTWFPRDLTLSLPDTAPANSAEIYYYQPGNPWQRYSTAISVEPGMTVTAKTVSTDPDHFEGSGEVAETYSAVPVTLDLMTTLLPAYSYSELGGALAPGSSNPVLAPPPQLLLANANDIPDRFESHTVFQSFWTWDGSNPATAGAGRFSGNATFENGYPGDPLNLTVAAFSGVSTLTLKYAALSTNTQVVTSSPVESATVAITPTPLLRPIVTPGSGSLTGGDLIVMSLDVTGAQTPAGARIFYRTDGVDPGVINGEPALGATQYDGSFNLAPDNAPLVQVVSRVYPPSQYKAWFTTSESTTMTYYLPYANENVYGVTGGNKNIYLVNPSTGANTLLDDRAAYNLRGLALDAFRARIYYLEEASGAAGWRLGYLDLITKGHATVGNIKGSWSYNASQQPQGLAFFNEQLYYIHKGTDDLVRITLNSTRSAITAVAKVADIRANSGTFSDIGDLAIDDTGLLFFCDFGKKYHRFDLMKMSGWVELGSCAEAMDGLVFYQARLFASTDGKDKLFRLSPNTGATLSSVTTSPLRKFVDLAAPSAPVPVSPSSSMWAINDQANVPHLIEFRNYRSPLISTAVDYGTLLYNDGNANNGLGNTSGSGIHSLAITNSGIAYFAVDVPVKMEKPVKATYKRALLKINLAGLVLGDVPVATFVGNLEPGLASIAGAIDPDDQITGLTVSPSGQLYGVLREGLTTGAGGADYLFRCTQTVGSMTGPTLSVANIGRLTSTAASSTNSEDLVFSRDGALYVSDTSDNEILRVNPDTGSILSVLSSETSADYRGLAVDNTDFRLVASNVGGAVPNTFFRVDGGPGNDDTYLNYQTRWGYTNIQAISFYQAPFLLVSTTVDLFAADGTSTIYGVDFETGQTVPATDAPFPVRALAYDLIRRQVFYLENDASSFRLGSFSVDSFAHQTYGNLKQFGLQYIPDKLPDNLMYFSGYLWYVEPDTDNLIQVQVDNTAILTQKKMANLTGNSLRFDAIGDLAMTPDGWMYFSCIRSDGQRFCRYRVSTLSDFQTLDGPIPPPVLVPEGGSYRENWFDALAFSPPAANGTRTLYGTYSSAPSPLRIVDQATGDSTYYKPTTPLVNVIDFSDQHPGDLQNPNGVTLQPLLAFSNIYPAYTYADVGGPFIAGLIPPPAPAPIPNVILSNPKEIQLNQQSSAFFKVKWSYDGVDPRTSPNALTCADFSNGFPPQPVSIAYNLWSSASSLPLKAVAKTQQASVMNDSPLIAQTVTATTTILRNPVIFEGAAVNGVRQVQITPNTDPGDCPADTRIYYTTDGTDPGVTTNAQGLDNPVTGQLYTGSIPVPTSGTNFIVTARVYPPSALPQWFKASSDDYLDLPLGLAGGHMDIDTSHLLYPFRKGATDGHIHEYDKRFNALGASFFAFATPTLHNVQLHVPAGTKFKIIVSNADLSPAGRLVINKSYNPSDSTTWIPVTNYDNTLPSDLPIYSLDGLAGTTTLSQFGLYFDPNAILSGGLLPTVTGHVKQNNPGLYGEWRNGALTIQVVKVNSNGTDAFTVNTSYSGGGVQGVATSGLLWETTFFWHHTGGPYGGPPGQWGR